MANREALIHALAPLLEVLRGIDVKDPRAAELLTAKFSLQCAAVQQIRQLVREGVEARWLCDRENAGVRYSRVQKSDGAGFSIDAVHMSGPGVAHLHPAGELDLCFAVTGEPRFDGRPEGWTVYAPQSWHVPTVEGGAMDILYFLPAGSIAFGPQPEGSTAVGLQSV
jgi:hypothetical protein